MSQKDKKIEYTFKIGVAGAVSVGKTNLILRYVDDIFDEDQISTVGVDFKKKCVDVDGHTVNIQFWDTAGEEKNNALMKTYYKNMNGAILVYDTANRTSFNKLEYWLTELRENCDEQTEIILLGNKNDLVEEKEVSTEEGSEFAKANNLYFMEVSALTNQDDCVIKAFNILFGQILKQMDGEKGKQNRESTYAKEEFQKKVCEEKLQGNNKKGCC